jgi:L-threonylcarbamoyladenylate synthase
VLVAGGRLPASGRGAYLWIEHRSEAARSIAMPKDPAAYARVLYERLHNADTEGWDWIAVEEPPPDPAWAAIRDRLERAAAR